jgi:hypothetical protein
VHDLSHAHIYDLCHALIVVAAAVGDSPLRRQLFDCALAVLGACTEAARLELLLRLLRGCPFAPVRVLLLNRVKNEVRFSFIRVIVLSG